MATYNEDLELEIDNDEEESEDEIEQNMLRDRAEKFPPVTDEMWAECDETNRFVYDEFFESNQNLSKETVKNYQSALKIFFWYVNVKLKNKPIHKIKKRDFLKYMGYLENHGLSSSGLKFKRSAVSSLCNFVAEAFEDEDEDSEYGELANFKDFSKVKYSISANKVYDKKKVTEEEYKEMISYLEEREDYMALAWVACAFNVGSRRAEIIQFRTEILDYEKEKDDEGKDLPFILTHMVRGKGKSRDGKPVQYMVNDEALKYMKLWVKNRGYEHDYIFTTKVDGEIKPVAKTWANDLCRNKLSVIAGRRINPHIFKASCITYLLEQGNDMKVVSKYVAQHNSVETTAIYDLREDTKERNQLFSN